ncbi:PREDICTED: DELTA-actitoxin-Afr1a-like [Acropora digitifera]|uniref:DELTA-actitoxin-Afr1a-like n=1 Tax=Acropora digitifera TaxID=70779 RepID=UPI00077A37CD|nr:PREDICTED: DELTA-actitoxin-Afr1a-like [Acropora digitifera]
MSLARLVILLFSILLITQSIFGSQLKHDHVGRNSGLSTNDTEIQGRQDPSSTFEDGERNNKRAVAAAGSLFDILKGVLDGLGSVNRKVAIGINNCNGITWYFIRAYLKHGTAGNDVPPKEVKPDEYFTYGARKTAGPVPRGVEGVLAFYLPRHRRRRPLRRIPSRTLVIMFSVPFLNTRPFYNNQFYIKSFEGKLDQQDVNENLFNEMYRDTKNRFKGDNTWHRDFELDKYFKADYFMSSAGTALIQIDVESK